MTESSVSPATHRYSREVARILALPDATEDLPDGRACRVEHVLAVVDQQQQPSAGDGVGDGVDQFGITLGCDAQCSGDGCRHRRRVTDRSELDQPHAVGELVRHLGAELEGESCLAYATYATQRDEPVGPHQLGCIRQ